MLNNKPTPFQEEKNSPKLDGKIQIFTHAIRKKLALHLLVQR